MSYTTTIAIPEVGKLYKIVHDPCVRGPSVILYDVPDIAFLKEPVILDGKVTRVPVWNNLVLVVEIRNDKTEVLGAFVLLNEKKLWMRATDFNFLERCDDNEAHY